MCEVSLLAFWQFAYIFLAKQAVGKRRPYLDLACFHCSNAAAAAARLAMPATSRRSLLQQTADTSLKHRLWHHTIETKQHTVTPEIGSSTNSTNLTNTFSLAIANTCTSGHMLCIELTEAQRLLQTFWISRIRFHAHQTDCSVPLSVSMLSIQVLTCAPFMHTNFPIS